MRQRRALTKLLCNMSEQIIAVDIDDVLARNAQGFTVYSNETWGTQLEPEDYYENWTELWGVSYEMAEARADKVHASGIFARYEPLSEAIPVLKKLKTTHNLIVVTSRRATIKDETEEWVESHFPGIFTAIHFAGIWDTEHDIEYKARQTKTSLCQILGVDYLIDDQVKHCQAFSNIGGQPILFGDYAWNRDGVQGVRRAINWAEVGRFFDGKS